MVYTVTHMSVFRGGTVMSTLKCLCIGRNTLEGDVSDVIAFDQLMSPFFPRKATRMSP